MTADSKRLAVGAALLAGFVVVLVVMFLPIFDGQNALNHMDALFNSISKGSVDYVPELRQQTAAYEGKQVELVFQATGAEQAELAARLLRSSGADVETTGSELAVSGDLGQILAACLDDSADLFRNDATRMQTEYGRDGKQVLFAWWTTLKAVDRELMKQDRFGEAGFVTTVKKKGVECAYNYYGIEPRKISDNIGIVLFSLVFYVAYTVWYGYAIILIFEGCGLKLSH